MCGEGVRGRPSGVAGAEEPRVGSWAQDVWRHVIEGGKIMKDYRVAAVTANEVRHPSTKFNGIVRRR